MVDKIRKNEVKIVYCPTDKMVADFSSKLLQGRIFVIHRNTMMGISIDDYKIYKGWYEESLKRYRLWDDKEGDLYDL